MSKVIVPAVSRHVWFHPEGEDRGLMIRRDGQPLHAVVIFVINERTVNLAITDHDGHFHTRIAVTLVQPGDELPGSSYATWMPYQVAQSKPPITEADALADLNGAPRPDNPTVKSEGIPSELVAGLVASAPAAPTGEDILGASGWPAAADMPPASESLVPFVDALLAASGVKRPGEA